MRHRPIMTGAYHKPSLFNKPLPRLSPQPVHITGMISARRKARANRIARQELLQENLALLESERKFEMRLAKNSADVGVLSELVYSDAYAQWRKRIVISPSYVLAPT